MKHYEIALPRSARVPIVLSVPHCGTLFPEELSDEYDPGLINAPDDTDWFVDQLYSFAPALGITMISAVWSRWVIDLNRHPESRPLYSDGRIITDLCPLTTFLGQPLYRDGRKVLPVDEIARRKRVYFDPWHEKLQLLINDVKREFGLVLLWDCHSIRQTVPTIQSGKLPDLILGSADGKSADAKLIEIALAQLGSGIYQLRHNDPFKGGFITRHYGSPERREHALQLEMSKINYMDDGETRFEPARAKRMGELLHKTLGSVSDALISMKD